MSISPRRAVIMSWSGGKDSAMALHLLQTAEEHADCEVVGLLTSVSAEYKRVSHHGVRETLLDRQAEALALPLDKLYLPSAGGQPCTNDVYEEIMAAQMAIYVARGIESVAFGDLFLEDLRAYRERNLARVGLTGLFPVWKRDTARFARDVIASGFRAILSCVEGKVGPGFAGRSFNEALLEDLPQDIDPCGEYGEFHTFVWDGPNFRAPVALHVGETVVRDGRFYADLLSDEVDSQTIVTAAALPPV